MLGHIHCSCKFCFGGSRKVICFCKLCHSSEKKYNNVESLQRHISYLKPEDFNVAKFMCWRCGYIAKTASDNAWVQLMLPQLTWVSITIRCDICQSTNFANAVELRDHYKLHKRSRVFVSETRRCNHLLECNFRRFCCYLEYEYDSSIVLNCSEIIARRIFVNLLCW